MYGMNSAIKIDEELNINISYDLFSCSDSGDIGEDSENYYCNGILVSKTGNDIKSSDGVVIGNK